MTQEPNVIVTVSRQFPQAPERLFDAWLDPKSAGRWLFATPTGEMVRVEIDGRVGGTFAIVERRDGEDVLHTGEYLAVDRPQRLTFTFSVPKYSPDADKVTVEFAPSGTGCEVTLTHEMDAKNAEWAESTKEGWAGILEGLAASLG